MTVLAHALALLLLFNFFLMFLMGVLFLSESEVSITAGNSPCFQCLFFGETTTAEEVALRMKNGLFLTVPILVTAAEVSGRGDGRSEDKKDRENDVVISQYQDAAQGRRHCRDS